MRGYWSTVGRLLQVLAILFKHGCAHAAGRIATRLRRPNLVPASRVDGPERLRLMLEEMGGTFIKFGQMLALQPDILPLEYCNALFRLLDRVAPFSAEEVDRVFLEDIGKTPAQVFDWFEREPVATASIGQVHVAGLNGRKYAVKIQRPRAPLDFGGDVRMIVAAVRTIRALRLRPLFWMIEPMSEFVNWTREELDYRYEARYMEQLHQNAVHRQWERIPEILREYTTKRILTAEFFEGHTVLSCLRALETNNRELLDRLDAQGFDSHVVAANIVDNFLGDVFEHGMFHADLHPANLIVLPGNVIGYIDFGITGVISMYSRQNLIELTLAYTRGDLDGMCESFFRVSSIGPESDIPAFREGLRRIGETWYEMEGRTRRLRKNFTLVMLDMLRLSRQTGIWPERDVIKYIRSAIAIDGLITRFAPFFDLSGHLSSVCDRYLKWHVRRSLFQFDSLLGWATAATNIATVGPARALHNLAAAGRQARSIRSDRRVSTHGPVRQRMLLLSTFIFTICIVASSSASSVRLGWNLFTAEAALAICAFLLLGSTVRQLRREE